MTTSEFLERLEGVKRRGAGWRARCPAHDDRRASLDIDAGEDGTILLNCRSGGCSAADVCRAIGVELRELFPNKPDGGRSGKRPKASSRSTPVPNPKRVACIEGYVAQLGARFGGRWDYHDADGGIVFVVVRVNRDDGGKDFRPLRPDGDGWVFGDPPGALPLFNLPGLRSGDDPVLVVEGEKCVEAGRQLGLCATTWAHGANAIAKTDWGPLAGRDVVLWPDADDPGLGAADAIAATLHKLKPPASVRIIDVDKLELPTGGDIADFIEDHDSRDDADLRAMIETMMSEAPVCAPGDAGQRLSVRSLAGVEPQPIEWLWPFRVPIGKVTIFSGYGDVGKSFITHAIGAVVSAGLKWPLSNDWAEVGDVLYLAHEDGIEDTIVPRLKAAGACMDRIAVIEGVIRKRGAEPDWVQLDTDLRHIDAALRARPGCRVLVVDPITAYLGSAESHKDADVRRVLGPLARLAETRRIAVVAILHWNKRLGAPAMLRGSGSVAFGNLARVVHAVAKDPRDATRHIMAVVKMNIAKHPPALGFRIEGDPPVVHWIADTPDIAADQLADGVKPKTQVAEVVEWLNKQLADGPKASVELIAEGIEEGFAEKTIRRAKRKAGIRHRTTTDDDGNKRTVWFLPEPAHDGSDGKAGQVGQVDQPDRGEAA